MGTDGGIIGDGERKKGYGAFSSGMRASKNGRQVLIGRINLRLWYLNERVSGFFSPAEL